MNKVPINIPASKAAEVWRSANPDVGLEVILKWCTLYGAVYSDKDHFVCARPWKDGAGEYDHVEDPDTWLIWLAAGNGVKRFFEIAPYALPKVAFHRHKSGNGKLHVYDWNRLRRKIYGNQSCSTAAA